MQASLCKDYKKYVLNKKELFFCYMEGVMIIAAVSFLFYKSYISFFCMVPFLWVYKKEKEKTKSRQRKVRLSAEFKEALGALSTALKAGYSIENAFQEAYRDLLLILGDNSDMVRELLYINRQVANNIVLEELLSDFARRSHLEDAKDFSEVFKVAKRSGGDLVKVMENTAHAISEKMQIKGEITTMIRGKEFEQKIMNIVPFGIIAYVSFTSPEFFNLLYHNLAGNIIMTLCLFIYILAFIMARKIIRIEV